MSVKEKEKISFAQLKKPIKNVIICLLHLAAGFILGMSEVSDGIKPFGVAFVSVSKKQNIIFSSAGAILGYMTDGLTAQSGGYFAAVVITGIGSFILDMLDISEKAVGLMCISGASITAADLFVSARAGMLGERLLIIIAQMTACAAFSYFYFKSMNADFRNLRFRALPFDDDFALDTLNHGRKIKYRNNISVSCFNCGSGLIGCTLRRNEMGTDSLDMHGIYARRRER